MSRTHSISHQPHREYTNKPPKYMPKRLVVDQPCRPFPGTILRRTLHERLRNKQPPGNSLKSCELRYECEYKVLPLLSTRSHDPRNQAVTSGDSPVFHCRDGQSQHLEHPLNTVIAKDLSDIPLVVLHSSMNNSYEYSATIFSAAVSPITYAGACVWALHVTNQHTYNHHS